MSIYGSFCGIHASVKWGWTKTTLGRSILMFTCGLIMQEFGQIIYSYYAIVRGNYSPYPSIGDVGYFGTIPFYACGAILLAKSSGVKLNIHSFKNKIISVIIPFLMLSIAYMLFFRGYSLDFNNPVKVFLDFAYPLGEAINISIALIIFIFSRKILDGVLKSKALLLLMALVVQFLADYIFVYYQTSFQPGDYIDLTYLIAYFIMTMALLGLKSIRVSIPTG
jgi:hypothetical protein